jgi:hypothetical protein
MTPHHRRFDRISRAVYWQALEQETSVGRMSDRQVVRMYTNMIAPTLALAGQTFDQWERLPLMEKNLAVLRMRHALVKVAPRA